MAELETRRRTYIISLNEAGDVVELDLTDPTLRDRYQRTVKRVRGLIFEQSRRVNRVNWRIETVTKRERKLFPKIDQAYLEMREAMDTFLGLGACQKIFGDMNSLEMWEDLLAQLGTIAVDIGLCENEGG